MFLLKKIFFFSLISSVLLTKNFLNSQEDLKSTSLAISKILKDQYAGKVWNLDFFIIGEDCRKFAMNVIGNVLKNISGGSFKSEIHYTKESMLRNKKFKLANSAVFFVERAFYAIQLNEQINMTNSGYLKFQHVIVILKKENIDYFLKEQSFFIQHDEMTFKVVSHHEIFFYSNGIDATYKIATTRRFTSNCSTILEEINEFNLNNQSWKNDNFGLIETTHFNGCPFKRYSDTADHVLKLKLNDLYYDFYEILGSKLNVTILENQKFNRKFPIIDTLKIAEESDVGHRFIYKFIEVKVTLIIHVGEEYNSYEKFYLPFDVGTWICCGIVFGSAFLIIFIINRTKNNRIQEIVYGLRVQHPGFNIVIAFFGESQNIVPTRSFGRFILIMFVIFCLIIRTAYQGVQFDLMYKVRF